MKKAPLFLIAMIALGCQGPVSEVGILQIRVKWPTERKTQVIPFFAESVQFTITTPQGNPLGQVTAVRTGALTSEASLVLPTGTVNIRGEAFSEPSPGTDNVPVARGSVDGVRILASKETPVKITLAGLVGIDTVITPQDEGIAANVSSETPASTGVALNIDTATASSEGLIFTIE